jgi:hypothetical protein
MWASLLTTAAGALTGGGGNSGTGGAVAPQSSAQDFSHDGDSMATIGGISIGKQSEIDFSNPVVMGGALFGLVAVSAVVITLVKS